MRAARRIYEAHPDVLFVVVGSDRICYGGDEKRIGSMSFREHVLAQDDYDLSRFLFTGLVPDAGALVAREDLVFLNAAFAGRRTARVARGPVDG